MLSSVKYLCYVREFYVQSRKKGSNISFFCRNKLGHYSCQSVIDVIGHKYFYFVVKGRKECH